MISYKIHQYPHSSASPSQTTISLQFKKSSQIQSATFQNPTTLENPKKFKRIHSNSSISNIPGWKDPGAASLVPSTRALDRWKECTTKLQPRPFTNICPAFYVCMHRVECTRGECSCNCSARCNESRAINFQHRIYYSLKYFRVKSAHGSCVKLKRSLKRTYEASVSLGLPECDINCSFVI